MAEEKFSIPAHINNVPIERIRAIWATEENETIRKGKEPVPFEECMTEPRYRRLCERDTIFKFKGKE